ncbi:MAG: PAS domain S-box protein [Cytophagales bacterium]|nr:PAS domain S-box protein [Cytophagales bacterium]
MTVKTNNVEKRDTDESFYVIGIGTSAGGLETLRKFFNNIPLGFGHSFVIIQHLSPDYKSLMSELLAHNTSMPIHEAKDGMRVEKSNIYLIPPKKNLTIKNGILELDDKPSRNQLNLPIDIFFKSLALDKGDNSFGIILSGTGSDGSQGIRYINDKDGFVMVEAPETSKFDGMPRSAIATGLADCIKPAEELAHELVRILSVPDTRLRNAEKEVLKREDAIQRMLFLMERNIGIDFSQYKLPTIARRITRRMMLLNTPKVNDYLNYLHENSNEINLLYKDLLIGVTRFFRDTEAFEILAQQVIPAITQDKSDSESIKVWISGCSTGEEAYSIAILFKEHFEQSGRHLPVKIFATDIAKESLEKASKGIYSEAIAADVSPKRLKEYFIHKDNQFQIRNDIRKMLIFSQHNILKDPPFTKVDFTSCRNLLIYIRSDAQKHALASLHYGLNTGGYLFLGASETLGELQRYFDEIDRHNHIYKNVEPVSRLNHSALNYQDSLRHRQVMSSQFPIKPANKDQRFVEVLHEVLHEELGAASVVVNETFEVLNGAGDYKKYLDLPSDKFSLNLLKMVPNSLATVLSSVVRKASKEEQKVYYKGFELKYEKERHNIDILVQPFGLGEGQNGLSLIVFFEKGVQHHEEIVLNTDETSTIYDTRISDLEAELKDTKENLQATLEEVETSNEELQAANEELLASNEELQSTNEELQSLNEELHTVNAEYQSKIRELTELNNDIENLLKSTNIGTIFLNREMRIRKFTPSIIEQFNLIESDIGRPIENFTNKLQDVSNQNIIGDALEVMQKGMPATREAQMKDGSWYLKRVHPFVDELGNIDGVVITFTNITELKKAKKDIELLEKKWRSILVQSPNFVFTTDNKGRYAYINRAPDNRGVGALMGTDAYLFAIEKDQQKLKETVKKALFENKSMQVEVTGSVDDKYYNLNISPQYVNNERVGLVCEATDISYRRSVEQERERLISNLELAQKMAHMGYYDLNLRSNTCETSENFRNMFGLREKHISLNKYHKFVHKEDHSDYINAFKQSIAEKRNFELEYRIVTNNKQLIYVRNHGYLQYDESDKPTKLIGLIQNITQIKQIQNEITLINELALGIGNAKDFDDALDLLLNKICKYNDWEYGEVWMPLEGGTKIECSHIYYSKLKKYQEYQKNHLVSGPIEIDQSLPGKIMSKNKPIFFPELRRLSKKRYLERELGIKMKFESAFGFPVDPGMGILGIFVFYNNTRIEKDENLIKLTDIITSQIGSILHRKYGEQLLLLKESEEWMSSILEAAPTGIVLTNSEGNIQQINEQIEEIFQYERGELINKNIDRFLDVRSDKLLKNVDNKDAGRPKRDIMLRGEYMAERKDGSVVPVEVGLNKMTFKNRTYFLASIVDITHRKEAEQMIKASEAKYMDLYERSPDMLISIDPTTGNIIDCNETTVKNTGYKKDEIIGNHVFNLYHKDCMELAKASHSEIFSGKELSQVELILRKKDMRTIDVLLNARTIVDEKGNILQVRVSWRDISALKQARQDLEKTLAKLGRTNKELEQFAYVASHDLKAPIANLSSLLFLLDIEKGINEDGRLIYDKAVASIEQMNHTIKTLNEVLSLKQNFSLEAKQIEFETILVLVKSGIGEQIKETSATINSDFTTCRTVKFPALHLQNILQNLITNAIKYKKQDVPPIVEITSQKNEEFILLTVKDNGSGIDLKQHGKKLFGLFKRFHLHTEGKGIGLYITKSIMENYHGKIEVESSLGSGTTFKLYFPQEPFIE